MTDDFRNMPIGSPTRTVIVQNVDKQTIELPDRNRTSEKIVFTVTNGDDREFNISDAWVEDHKGARKIQGLWFTTSLDQDGQTRLSPACALSKLLRHYEADTIQDMIGKHVIVHPDEDNYLVLAACDINKAPEKRAPLFETEK